jgi:hypothetical protein
MGDSIMASIIRATTTSGLQIAPDNSGSLQLQTNGTTTAVTIDTSQNVTTVGNTYLANSSGSVGINTTSPSTKLDVNSGSAGYALTIQASGETSRKYQLGVLAGGALSFYDTAAAAERMRIDSSGNLLFNSGYGSVATAYGCRAWVNFNGTGTVAIRASGNVTSITDNGTGNYTVNFTTAMPDVNYSGVIGSGNTTTSDPGRFLITINNSATSSCSIFTKNANTGTLEDYSVNCVAIFR